MTKNEHAIQSNYSILYTLFKNLMYEESRAGRA